MSNKKSSIENLEEQIKKLQDNTYKSAVEEDDDLKENIDDLSDDFGNTDTKIFNGTDINITKEEDNLIDEEEPSAEVVIDVVREESNFPKNNKGKLILLILVFLIILSLVFTGFTLYLGVNKADK